MSRTEDSRIPGVYLIIPEVQRDDRGFFCRTSDWDVVDTSRFVQEAMSRSAYGTVRGLHIRTGRGEAKLVRCAAGAIFDVVVDLRRGSPTYRTWQSFELNGYSQVSLYIPPGCAHGFQAMAGPADVAYRISRMHAPARDFAIAHDDPELAIPWPLPVTQISQRDKDATSLALYEKMFP